MTSMPGGASSATRSGTATRCTSPRPATIPACTCRRPAAAASAGRDGDAREHDQGCAHRPHLITNVETTDATVPDNQMTEPIHDPPGREEPAPGRHYVDSGYLSADLLVSSLASYGIALVTPMLADTSPQARAGAGYDRTDFAIDFDTRHATCPQGQTSSSWTPFTQRGTDTIVITFPPATAGPARPAPCAPPAQAPAAHRAPPRPGPSPGRRPGRRNHEGLPGRYALRAGVEGTIRQAASHGMRHARYRGLPKTRLDHAYIAGALNLIRLHAWWNGHPLDRTRTSHLARLELALAS